MTRPLACPSGRFGLGAAVGVAMLCGVAAGCAGSLDPSLTGEAAAARVGPPPCDAPNMVIQPNCGIPGCHGSAGPVSGLDLTAAGIVARLLDQKPTSASMMCGGNTTPYLKSGSNPATGLLLDKLTMSAPPCGNQMPGPGGLGDAIKTMCVTDWATAVTTGVITQ